MTPDEPQQQREVRIVYTKSPTHRVVHCAGVFGGLAPNGDVYAAIFSQHGMLPKAVVHRLEQGKQGGQILKEEVRREGEAALEREVEVALVMDLGTAMSFRGWLDEKIAQAVKLGVQMVEDVK